MSQTLPVDIVKRIVARHGHNLEKLNGGLQQVAYRVEAIAALHVRMNEAEKDYYKSLRLLRGQVEVIQEECEHFYDSADTCIVCGYFHDRTPGAYDG